MSIKSFDIFDTCLVRATVDTYNTFDLLAREVLGCDAPQPIKCDFAQERMDAERRAIRKKNGEVTLKEIYAECDFIGMTDLPNDKIMETELRTEKSVLVPVARMQKFIARLHDKGESVLFISDMYLPSDFLLHLLRCHGFWKEGDKLYVSCESGATKKSGRLFRLVKEENHIGPMKWHHYGDNFRSDFISALKKGIIPHRVKYRYLPCEKLLLDSDYNPLASATSQLAGLSRAVRLSQERDNRVDFAADLIAPLYAVYVNGILTDALDKGMTDLYFMTRDGYILYETAKTIQSCRPEFDAIRLHMLYISRSSIYLPAMRECSREQLSYLLSSSTLRGRHSSVTDTLSQILPPHVLDEIKTINKNKDIDPLDNSDAVEVIKRYYTEQRALIRQYFTQLGMTDPTTRGAVIDVNGSRRTQKHINDLLADFGAAPLSSYYLVAGGDRLPVRETGPYTSLYMRDRCRGPLKNLKRLTPAFEQYYSACPFGRTISYARDNSGIIPVYDNATPDTWLEESATINTSVTKTYAEYFFRLKLDMHQRELYLKVTEMTARFADRPARRYLKVLKNLLLTDGTAKPRYMIFLMTPFNIIRKRCTWTQGSVFYTFGSFLGRIFN